jgi:hypothetical protein
MFEGDFKAWLDETPDEYLSKLQFTMPWQGGELVDTPSVDPDGMPIAGRGTKDIQSREALQAECWRKFNANPQVNTAIRGVVGRIVGLGFEATSEVARIQAAIDEIELDWRNRLYDAWPKFTGRALVEGELNQILTLHKDGFVEVDFLDPSLICEKGDEDTGIIWHPTKTTMPLIYNVKHGNSGEFDQIPSIYIARQPNLIDTVRDHKDFKAEWQLSSRSVQDVYKPLGGYYRFVLSWNRGFMTRRAVSYLRTTLEWLNHYENLKKFEIDHKRSSGAYAWVFSFSDPKAFRLWVSLSEEDRKKTGVMAKIKPGSRLFLPPGMEVTAKNPNLPRISDADTDIMQMITSGLNEPSDVTTGTVGGTFASVKATRGPMADRTSDEVAYFDRFYRHDFWGSIFYLKSVVSNFPKTFGVEEAIGFKDREPVMKTVRKSPELLIDISHPVSESVDLESRSKAILGVKHGPLTESIGLPGSRAAGLLGVGGYGRNRLRKATEDARYPPVVYSVDAESVQEKAEGEPVKPEAKKSKSEN